MKQRDLPAHCRIMRFWEPTRKPSNVYGRGWRGPAEESDEGSWFLPDYLSGSDYSGNLIEQSNLRVFQETFPSGEGRWWVELHGGYGTFGVLVRTLAYQNCTEVREFFDALEDYPLASEDDHTRLEIETVDEAWEDHGAADFRRAAARVLSADASEVGDVLSEMSDNELWLLFQILADQNNVNGGPGWMNEQGGSIYFMHDDVLAGWDGRLPTNYGTCHELGETSLEETLETGRDFIGPPCPRCYHDHDDCRANPSLAAACDARQ